MNTPGPRHHPEDKQTNTTEGACQFEVGKQLQHPYSSSCITQFLHTHSTLATNRAVCHGPTIVLSDSGCSRRTVIIHAKGACCPPNLAFLAPAWSLTKPSDHRREDCEGQDCQAPRGMQADRKASHQHHLWMGELLQSPHLTCSFWFLSVCVCVMLVSLFNISKTIKRKKHPTNRDTSMVLRMFIYQSLGCCHRLSFSLSFRLCQFQPIISSGCSSRLAVLLISVVRSPRMVDLYSSTTQDTESRGRPPVGHGFLPLSGVLDLFYFHLPVLIEWNQIPQSLAGQVSLPCNLAEGRTP